MFPNHWLWPNITSIGRNKLAQLFTISIMFFMLNFCLWFRFIHFIVCQTENDVPNGTCTVTEPKHVNTVCIFKMNVCDWKKGWHFNLHCLVIIGCPLVCLPVGICGCSIIAPQLMLLCYWSVYGHLVQAWLNAAVINKVSTSDCRLSHSRASGAKSPVTGGLPWNSQARYSWGVTAFYLFIYSSTIYTYFYKYILGPSSRYKE